MKLKTILPSLLVLSFLFLGTTNSPSDRPVRRLKLIFAGDIMGHGPQIKSAEIVKNELYDYDPCFRYIQPILEEADLAIGNLELTLPGRPPYHGWPNFRSPDDLAIALRKAGFDVLTTANNHSNDAGKNGVIQTIATLENNGFYHTGTYRNAFEKALFHPLLVYKKGFQLAFLNYTYGTDQKKHRPPTIVNLIDEASIKKDLQRTRRMKPDAIIVMIHWGKEYQLDASSEQRKLARRMANWGADLVIGSHPHVVQPIEEYFLDEQKPDGEMNLFAYSLGNFISNQKKINTDTGILLEVDLIKTDGNTSIEDYHYLPIWRYIRKPENGKPIYHCIPIASYEKNTAVLPDFSKEDETQLIRSAQFIRDHLADGVCPEKILTKETSNALMGRSLE